MAQMFTLRRTAAALLAAAANDAIENVKDDAGVPDEAKEALEQAQQDLEQSTP
jgi:hypothetical protein